MLQGSRHGVCTISTRIRGSDLTTDDERANLIISRGMQNGKRRGMHQALYRDKRGMIQGEVVTLFFDDFAESFFSRLTVTLSWICGTMPARALTWHLKVVLKAMNLTLARGDHKVKQLWGDQGKPCAASLRCQTRNNDDNQVENKRRHDSLSPISLECTGYDRISRRQ